MINWCNIAHKTEIKRIFSTNAFLLGNTVCWDWGKQSVGRNCYKICHLGDTIPTLQKIKNGQNKCVIDTREFKCFHFGLEGNISISEFWSI